MTTIKYYSFLIGQEKSTRSNWITVDLKIPATNVKEALFIYFTAREYRRNQKDIFHSADKTKYCAPIIINIEQEIKRVIEYTRLYTPKRGYTQHQFKKIRHYSYPTLLKLYPSFNVNDYIGQCS